jgi:hypothetical protein
MQGTEPGHCAIAIVPLALAPGILAGWTLKRPGSTSVPSPTRI